MSGKNLSPEGSADIFVTRILNKRFPTLSLGTKRGARNVDFKTETQKWCLTAKIKPLQLNSAEWPSHFCCKGLQKEESENCWNANYRTHIMPNVPNGSREVQNVADKCTLNCLTSNHIMHQAAWHLWENIYCWNCERKICLRNILSLLCSKQFKICFTRGFDYCKWQGLGTAVTQRVFIEADMFATGYLWPCWLLASHHKLESRKELPHYLDKWFVDNIARYMCMYIEEHIEKNPSQM